MSAPTLPIRRCKVAADDPDYGTLPDEEYRASGEWLAANGFPHPVFQVEYDVLDCPMLRAWWLTQEELSAIPGQEIDEAEYGLLSFAHVTERALREPLPWWWRPEPTVEDDR